MTNIHTTRRCSQNVSVKCRRHLKSVSIWEAERQRPPSLRTPQAPSLEAPPHLGHLLQPSLDVCQLQLGLLELGFQLLVFSQGVLVELGE